MLLYWELLAKYAIFMILLVLVASSAVTQVLFQNQASAVSISGIAGVVGLIGSVVGSIDALTKLPESVQGMVDTLTPGNTEQKPPATTTTEPLATTTATNDKQALELQELKEKYSILESELDNLKGQDREVALDE